MPIVKNPPAEAGETRNTDSIPRLGRSLGERNVHPLSIFAWRIQGTEKPGNCKEWDITKQRAQSIVLL